MNTEEKKAWLGRYLQAKRTEGEILMEIEALENEFEMPARRMDGMPRGGSGRDLSDLAATVEPLWIRLREQLQTRVEICREIVDVVERSPITETQRAILRYKYIMGMTWPEIEEAMHMETSWMSRLRDKAVDLLDV